MVVPVGLVGGIIWWALHVQKRRNAAWQALAARLGLSFAPGSVWGMLDGQLVQLRIEVRGSGKHKQTWTVATGMLQPPLDLGLGVTPQGLLSSLGRLFGAQDVPLGDPAFDDAFVIKADEPARAATLLSPQLRAVLLQLRANGSGFSFSDAGGQIERRGGVDDAVWLEWAVKTVALLARLASEARAFVPCAAPLAVHRDAWLGYARDAGLTGMDTPLCIWGRMQEASVSAYSVRVGPMLHRLEVFVRFDAPLAMGLVVRPQGALDGLAALFGGQDHATGDRPFDGAFVVKATTAGQVSEVLDGEVRQRLLEMSARGFVPQIRDDGVTVRAPSFPPDPSEVPRILADAKAAARAIVQNATRRAAGGIGPYR